MHSMCCQTLEMIQGLNIILKAMLYLPTPITANHITIIVCEATKRQKEIHKKYFAELFSQTFAVFFKIATV